MSSGKKGVVPAKRVAEVLNKELGWNKNTTYTLIKRCMKKGGHRAERAKFHVPCAGFAGGSAGGRDQ